MDKQKQESFFKLLKSTYEITESRKDVSLEEIMKTLKSELSVLFTENN